jgi:hypothetical protein
MLASAAALLVSLAFLSLLLRVRLSAAGAARAAVRNLLIELWLAVGLWTLLFLGIRSLLGNVEPGTLSKEASSLGQRIALARGPAKALCLALGLAALAALALLLRQIGRALNQPSPPVESREEPRND